MPSVIPPLACSLMISKSGALSFHLFGFLWPASQIFHPPLAAFTDPFGPHLARRADRDLVPRLRQHGSRDERFFYLKKK
jgi:hypothetical protein